MYYAIELSELYGVFGNRTTIPNLSQSRLKQFAIPKLEKEEQDRIANKLQVMDQKLNNHGIKKNLLQELFNSMLNKLMTGQINSKKI